MSETPGGSNTPPPPPPQGAPPPAGGGGGGDIIMPSSPPKEPILILVLNLLIVCVGYFILGQWQKGLTALVVALVIGVPTCGFGIGAVALATAIDGFMQAEALKAGHPVGQWTFFKDHR